MADSPHQPKTLSDRITELKEDLESKKALRRQMEVLGQTTSSAGTSTTYPGYADLCERISVLEAYIESLVAQLVGAPVPVPGVVMQQFRSDYAG